MPKRAYVGAVVGFVVGFLISQWFTRGAPENEILTAMGTACGLVGAAGGFATGVANKAGLGRDKIAGAVTVAACLLIGFAIWVYRWLFL